MIELLIACDAEGCSRTERQRVNPLQHSEGDASFRSLLPLGWNHLKGRTYCPDEAVTLHGGHISHEHKPLRECGA